MTGCLFDLIDWQWLLVRSLAGRTEELSLLDSFRRAHDLVVLLGEVSTQVFTFTRLLLAVLHPGCGRSAGPSALAAAVAGGAAALDNDIQREYRERFDLFHPKTPFLQVAGLHTAKNEVRS